ncbi:hypothetical protein I6D97_10970 [Staphylococcus aureus]|nr:hypothetical protein [Staphylococcus aureus]
MKSMVEMQREVDEYIGQFKTGYFSPLANLARFNETMEKFNTRDKNRFERK